MDRGTQWFPGSDPGSSRACKRRGRCKWVRQLGRLPGGGGGGGCRSAGSGPQHGAGAAASSPLGAQLSCPFTWSWRPSLHTHTTLEEGELAEPCLAPPELWAPPGVRISPPAWENPQLWGSLRPVGKGVYAHARTWTRTLTPGRTWRLTGPLSRAHTAWGLGSRRTDPPACGPWEGPFPMSLFAGAPHPTGVPPGAQPSWVWEPGHWPFLCFPCTDSHCPPTIPRHILFNNLSLLNYLLAFTTSPPPPCPPRSPSALPTKAENGNNNKNETSVYL